MVGMKMEGFDNCLKWRLRCGFCHAHSNWSAAYLDGKPWTNNSISPVVPKIELVSNHKMLNTIPLTGPLPFRFLCSSFNFTIMLPDTPTGVWS